MGRGGDEDLSVDQLCGELLFGNQSSAGHWPEGSWNAAGPGVEHQQQAPKQEGSSWSEQGVIVPQSQWLYMPELDNLAGGAHHGEQRRAVTYGVQAERGFGEGMGSGVVLVNH